MILTDIFRHPVKSLGAESLGSVRRVAGKAMPGDRRYGIVHPKSRFNRASPAWAPCENFLRIANLPTLAAHDVSFDPDLQRLAIMTKTSKRSFDLSDSTGRGALAAFIETLLQQARPPGALVVAQVPDVSLSDRPEQAVSLGSRASLRALEAACGRALDVRRFRMNLWIDGPPPWREFDLVGHRFQIGGVLLEGIAPIPRCLAPAANPVTGRRDVNPLKVLSSDFGHTHFGVLARVVTGSNLETGAAFTRP